ncbi:MAG: phosphate ABC transporter, permease protein PstA, partial [Clostridia bacterium]|nr:phosphate ABC transporter, permease protein PstA [Clostridia bacterium]
MHNKKRIDNRIKINNLSKHLFSLSTVLALGVLGILFYRIIIQSVGWLDLQFLTSKLSIFPDKAGIKSVIIGTIWLMAVVAPVTLFLGVATAIYLEEYSGNGRLKRIIQVNISNLAGVPSVIFG